MPFGPVEPFDLVALEARVLTRWAKDDVIGEVRRLRADAEPWVFYEGPPTANGRPGVHHVWARVFKDLYPRFQTMRGHRVPRKGGWDCHGLPVEVEVEKELGLTSKADIEAYGVAAFNERCRASVQRYVGDFTSLTERAGVWIDTDDAYWTLDDSYIESVWWLVRQLWDRGLLYEGHRVSPYCPRCGTTLSSHEMGQPGVYRDVTDPSAYVRFPLRPGSVPGGHGGPSGDADLVVWTTTPWTLLSNVAAAVGPDIAYVRLRLPDGGRDVVLAEAAAGRLFPAGDGDGGSAPRGEVVWRGTGHELAGARYDRPFTMLGLGPGDAEAAERVVLADYVSTEEGSGIVHLAPAFGEEDASIGRAEGLPVLNPVGPDGTFTEAAGAYAGLGVKAADPSIIADLDRRGLLVAAEPHLHSYPHCWRCSTPLIYWAKTSWFARTSDRRAELLEQNATIGWHPEHIRDGRFGKWLEHNVDWALSRDRYWGTPLPLWRCEGGHDTCIGSVAELSDRAGRDLSSLDLHRPYVDEVTFPCSHDGCDALATRLPPVLDAWFDSGSMPSAQHHHPFADGAFETSFPADFICEAIDQTRGWFYSLLAVNTLAFDATPYRNVVCLGFIVDADGQKMSKSKGNIIDPWYLFDTQGADALRWYFFSAGQPWTARRVFEDGIRESTRQTLLTLWNVFSFFATYADLDGWQPEAGWSPSSPAPEATHVLDRWILGELADTAGEVTEALDGFDALRAAQRIGRLVDDLSNWYVRRSRPRFWKSSDPAAHATLHHVLVKTAELLAPFTPFLADELWGTLTGGLSVHAADWPSPPASAADPGLVAEMAAARTLVALGRAARTDARIRTRQPLRRALVLHPGVELSAEVRAEIAEELNVHALEDVDTLGDLVSWTVVPNFRALGPRLGPKVNEVKAALAAADGSALQRALEADGQVEVAGVVLGADEVQVRAESHGDLALAQEGPWAVALDLELDEGLRVEGAARELVRIVNDLRKEQGFAIADRIDVSLHATGRAADAVASHGSWLAGEVLALRLEVVGSPPEGAVVADLDGEPVALRLTPAGA
jgi:isoleucyl-tRNA synthetase